MSQQGGSQVAQDVTGVLPLNLKGTLINPNALLAELSKMHHITEYQIVLTKEDPADPLSMEQLVVRVASDTPDEAALCKEISTMVQRTVEMRPIVELTSKDDIFEPEKQVKAVRVVDRRPVVAQ